MQEVNTDLYFVGLLFKIYVNTKIFSKSIHIKIARANLSSAYYVHGPFNNHLIYLTFLEVDPIIILILKVSQVTLNVCPSPHMQLHSTNHQVIEGLPHLRILCMALTSKEI